MGEIGLASEIAQFGERILALFLPGSFAMLHFKLAIPSILRMHKPAFHDNL
jgi:hypothetical protein